MGGIYFDQVKTQWGQMIVEWSFLGDNWCDPFSIDTQNNLLMQPFKMAVWPFRTQVTIPLRWLSV